MRTRRPLMALLAATAGVLILAAACSGDDDAGSNGGNGETGTTATSTRAGDGSGGSGYKPCDLLTREEVEAVLGEAIEAPETSITGNPLGQTLCMYSAAAENSFAYVQLSIIREKDIMEALRKSGQSAKKLYTEGKALYEAGKVRDVPGIGDAAYREGATLTLLSGGTLMSVSALVKGTQPADLSTDILKSLAQKALDRLPK